jgi:hypothetical protein
MAVEPGQQIGGWRAPQAATTSCPWGRVGGLPVGQQPLVAGMQPSPRLVVDPPAASGPGLENGDQTSLGGVDRGQGRVGRRSSAMTAA